MAGKLRVEYGGAIDHLRNRGDRRERNFQNDPDRVLFLDPLAETCRSAESAELECAKDFGASRR
jgi:hypothetical protein